MKRIIIITLVLLVGISAMVSAQGVPEATGDGAVVLNSKTYFGPVSVEDGKAVITSGSEKYVLHYHPLAAAGVTVGEGDYIRVEGYLLPDDIFDDGKNHVMAARAVIDGTTYLVGPVAEQGRLIIPEEAIYRMIPGRSWGGMRGQSFQAPSRMFGQPRFHGRFNEVQQDPRGRFSGQVHPMMEKQYGTARPAPGGRGRR